MMRLGLLMLAACATSPDTSVESPGQYAVGTKATSLANGERTLGVQLFFPTADATSDTPFAQLELPEHQAMYGSLLASAPSCPTRSLDVGVDATPLAGSFPVVLFSHCHSCTRLSNATTATRLASHGFVVVSVDHTGDALWDDLAGHPADLTSAELQLRASDVRTALDAVPTLIASADAGNVGVFGHSFGSVTAGEVAQDDDRIKAAAGLCAPMDNPLTPGVSIAKLTLPLMFVLAVEDNSITQFGNTLIENNYRDAPDKVWKFEVPDAGHWSVSDINGLTDDFKPGCGDATRMSDGSNFTYLDPSTGRQIAASYVTAYFKSTLQGDAGATAYLDDAHFGVDAMHE